MVKQILSDEDWRAAYALAEPLLDMPVEEALRQVPAGTPETVVVCLRSILTAASEQKTWFGRLEAERLSKGLRSLFGWSGRDVGGYVLESLLAVGGLSVIYRAYRACRPAQTVAVKLLFPGYSGHHAMRLYRQERRALLRLKHPQIVRLLDSGRLGDSGYLVLEYLPESRSLDDYARCRPDHTRELVEFVLMVANAMKHVHAQGVVHNDLKADNILIMPGKRIKIIDFGIACLQKSSSREMPLVADAAYTPFIAAPEQIQGHAITAQVDVFLLGATLLHVLSGEKPLPSFTPESYSPVNDERYVEDLLEKSGLDFALCRIVRRALRTSRRHRYPDMHSFAADLRTWLQIQNRR